MTHILSVVGARPQFIKTAPVSVALRSAGLRETLVHTGQHYDADMSDRFFDELELQKPRYNLGIGSGPHGNQTARMLIALEPIMIAEKPDWVLIYGDTNSTLAAALVAAKLALPVAHVEAGLRSYNRKMPEEINRIAADRLSTLLFAPTKLATDTLKAEGFAADAIVQTGDVMYDAALHFVVKARHESRIGESLGLKTKSYILATIHRAENTDDPVRLAAVIDGLDRAARDMPVVVPLHPRTRKALNALGLNPAFVTLIDPVGYIDMVALTAGAALIVTDSGGLQKEAYFHGVRCVTLRDETEWRELVDAGWNRLLPPVDAASVSEGIGAALAQPAPTIAPRFYGNGDAALMIAARFAT